MPKRQRRDTNDNSPVKKGTNGLNRRQEKQRNVTLCVHNGEQYYSTIFAKHLGENISVGDFVYVFMVKNERCIAVIESIFKSSDKSYQFEARWFDDEIRGGHELLENELVETDNVDICDIGSIDEKIIVLPKSAYDLLSKQKQSETYFYKTFYCAELKMLRPVASDSANARKPGMYSKKLPRNEVDCLPSLCDDEGSDSGCNRFNKATQRLQSSAVPSSLPCREKERDTIMTFLTNNLSEQAGGALYISGMPGTGKTATVREVIRSLQTSKKYDFDYIEINGMKLSHPYHAYTLLYKALTKEQAGPERAAQLLERRFSAASSTRRMCVVLVDELDYIVTRRQTVLFNLFDWPTRKDARLIVMGIANTMDLPERFFPKIQSRLGMTRVVFQSYTRQQIECIVSSRLQGLSAFDEDAVQMCSRKVASLSGDIRRALQICRRAAELCNMESHPVVTLEHINRVAADLSGNLYIRALQQASLLEKVFLISIYKFFEAQGREECSLFDVWSMFEFHCKRLRTIQVPSLTEATLLCDRLGNSRMLKVRQNDDERYPTVRLGVEQDDIKFALQGDDRCGELIS